VDVYVEYLKIKTVYVNEYIDIDKDVTINVDVDVAPERGSEAEALINQTNVENEGCFNCAEKQDNIIGSVLDNSGLTVVNQAAGNMNNQGSAISISVDVLPGQPPEESPKTGGAFANAQAAADQRNKENRQDANELAEKSALITGSINNNSGVIHVNQAPGNMNNQANALAMAVGFGEGNVALAESDLGQINKDNSVNESAAEGLDPVGVNKQATITASIVGNSGVVGVNQAAGNMANQANVVSFAVVEPGI
jgi:hypothetical protein